MDIKTMQEHMERLENARNMLSAQLSDFAIDSIKSIMHEKERGTFEFPEPMEHMYCEGDDVYTTVYGLEYDRYNSKLHVLCHEAKYDIVYFDADTIEIFFYKLVNEVI